MIIKVAIEVTDESLFAEHVDSGSDELVMEKFAFDLVHGILLDNHRGLTFTSVEAIQ